MKRTVCQLLLIGQCAFVANTLYAQPGYSFVDETVTQNECLFWDQMDDAQRAALWPVLTQEQRLSRWRFMNKTERRALRNNLKTYRGFKLNIQYAGDSSPFGTIKHLRQMTHEELTLLRKQVHRASAELRSGIPFDCADPRNCPNVIIRLMDGH